MKEHEVQILTEGDGAEATTGSNRSWNRRPGAVMEEALRLALALGVLLIGIALFLAGKPNGPYWLPLWAIAAIATWLMTPRLFRAASRAGAFGRVRLKDGRLFADGRRHIIDLERPMTVEARLQRTTLRHRFRLSEISPNFSRLQRTSITHILMMTVVIQQDENALVLVADATDHLIKEVPDLDGLNLRRVGISSPSARVVSRLWPQDLVELLGALQTAAGYQTALSPVPDRPPQDPRRPVWPLWKMATGLTAVLLIWMAFVWGTFAFFQNLHHNRLAREAEKARLEASQAEETTRSTYMGERVTAPMRKWRVEGRVDDVVMVKKVEFEPKMVEFMAPILIVTVEAIFDENNERMDPDAEIFHRHVDDLVRVGSRIELDPEKARLMKRGSDE